MSIYLLLDLLALMPRLFFIYFGITLFTVALLFYIMAEKISTQFSWLVYND